MHCGRPALDHSRFYRFFYCFVLVCVGVIYYEIITGLPTGGFDFKVFYAAARLLLSGGHPYDATHLLDFQRHLLHFTPDLTRRYADSPYVEGPQQLLLYLPLASLPFNMAYALFFVFSTALVLTGCFLLQRLWPCREGLQRTVLFVFCPVAVLGSILGQPESLFFLAISLSFYACMNGREGMAGAVLAFTAMKPQLCFGVILVFALIAFQHRRLRAFVVGVVISGALTAALVVLVWGGDVFGQWMHELQRFSVASLYRQYDQSSLSAIYTRWLPHQLFTPLSLLFVVAWAVTCGVLYRKVRDQSSLIWWAMWSITMWLLVTPYAHAQNDIVLIPVVWYVWNQVLERRRISFWTLVLLAAFWTTWWAGVFWGTAEIGYALPIPLPSIGLLPVSLLLLSLWGTRRDAFIADAKSIERSSRRLDRRLTATQSS